VPELPAGLSRLGPTAIRQGEDHAGFELAGDDLEGARLTRTTLETARLERCRCLGVTRGARLHSVVFANCDLANSAWIDCIFTEVAFLDCRLTGVAISGGRFWDVVLRDCNAQMMKLSHTGRPHMLLEACDLRGALLMDTDFGDARFSRCRLEAAELFNAGFLSVDLRGNDLTGLRGMDSLRGATIDALQLLELGPVSYTHLTLPTNREV